MKKNYNYFLLAAVSVATLLVIAIIPMILKNDNSVTVQSIKSEKSSDGHLMQKPDPGMSKKQSMIQKPDPRMSKKQSMKKPDPRMSKKQSMKKPDPRMSKKQSMMQKLSMNKYKKSQITNNHKIGMMKIYDLTGIKVIFDKDKNVKITYITPNSNAENVNIKLNDTIVSINNTSLSGVKSIDIAKLIYNSNNKTIQMTIERNGEKFSVILKI
jgi:C-terminal processing protease CtpA/Prc